VSARNESAARSTSENTRPIYEFTIREDTSVGGGGWWFVSWRYTYGSPWETVARVFGERRAEIVRDALSQEANERVLMPLRTLYLRTTTTAASSVKAEQPCSRTRKPGKER
jgi:hypothetical protein